MNLDLIEITTYVSIGILIYYFLIELTKPKEGAQKWIVYLFVGLIVLIIGYFLWVTWQKNEKKKNLGKKGENPEDEEDMNDDDNPDPDPDAESNLDLSEHETDFINMDYTEQNKDFTLTNKISAETGQINYEDFKLWYLSPDFLEEYTSAIRQGLQIKRQRLTEVKRKFTADFKALKSKITPKEGLAGLLSSIDKNDDTKMLENTISEINLLLEEIKTRERNLNINIVRKGLISAVTDRDNGIDSIIDREEIKNFLALQIYTFAQNPRIFFSNFQNMAIYGGAGTGKTKLAQVIGHVYASCGILVRNHVHITTKQSFTTAYVNESSKMTKRLLLGNLESVVFIDEAYDITPPTSFLSQGIDHGHEAIAEMVNFIDKMKGLSIIIVAGYEKEMEKRFMQANEGLPRRFPNKLILKPYKPKGLTDILIKFIKTTCPELNFNKTHGNYLYTVISYLNNNPEIFKYQAGDMENLGGFITRSIYGTPGKTWKRNAEDLILNGINGFLSAKNIMLEEV